jgi:hypothetical protein
MGTALELTQPVGLAYRPRTTYTLQVGLSQLVNLWGRMGYWCPPRSSKPSVRCGASQVGSIPTRSRQKCLCGKGFTAICETVFYLRYCDNGPVVSYLYTSTVMPHRRAWTEPSSSSLNRPPLELPSLELRSFR